MSENNEELMTIYNYMEIIFSDHNMMSSVMNWVQQEENTQKKNSYDKSGIHKVQRDAAKWESEQNLGNVNFPTNQV